METIKMWGIKCDFSKEEDRRLKGLLKKIRQALNASFSGVVMEGEDPFVPWFYLMFKTRAERDAFHKTYKGGFGNIKLTRVYGKPAEIPTIAFTKEYLEQGNHRHGRA